MADAWDLKSLVGNGVRVRLPTVAPYKVKENTMPKTNVTVRLIGEDGNAFAIIGRVSTALKKAGYHQEAKDFTEKCFSGDYDNILRLCMEYVNVE